jgi:hypothetical protein
MAAAPITKPVNDARSVFTPQASFGMPSLPAMISDDADFVHYADAVRLSHWFPFSHPA